MPNRCTNPNDTNQYRLWARRILCGYPRAWRERYESEMEQVLLSHAVTFWTLLDLLLGALDARLHPNLLPRRITTMMYRLRTSEIVIFCAFVAYSVAWFAVRFVRDPIPVWEHVVQVHPEIRTALVAVDSFGVMALLALGIGGVPMVYVVLRNALRDRQWRLLGLLAVPPLALTVLFSYALLAGEVSTQRAPHGTPDAPFTTLALILQFGFVLLLLAAVGGSTIAVALAVRRSHLSDRLLCFGLIPAAVVTLSMLGGLVATIILTVLIFGEAPQLQGSPGNLEIVIVFMGGAAVTASNALWHGWRTSREHAA
jgi:hypothetical protein